MACGRFLEVTPEDFTNPDEYYRTEEQLETALTAVYNPLGSTSLYGRDYIVRMNLEADEGFINSQNWLAGPMVYNFSASDGIVSSFWRYLYIGIDRANHLLMHIDKNIGVPEGTRNRIKGEARFLRAYYYFLLVQHFEGVPLIIEPIASPEETQIQRATIAEVYAQILEDMKSAELLVGAIRTLGFSGRVNQSAVRAILSRVCLYMAGYPLRDTDKYAEARMWAKKVIDDTASAHDLNSSYEQVFIGLAQDVYDIDEVLWEIEFWGNASGTYNRTGTLGAWIGISSNNTTNIGTAYGFISCTAKLYNLYENQDLRRDVAVAPYQYLNNGNKQYYPSSSNASLYERRVGKYRREHEVVTPKANNATPTNMPVVRFSDVLLMFAESENEINGGPTAEAIEAVNRVRQRANASSIESMDKIDFFDFIVNERSRELCFEGLRKPDLVRWGIFVSTMKGILNQMNQHIPSSYLLHTYRNVADRHVVLPIPTRELAVNRAMEQNQGW